MTGVWWVTQSHLSIGYPVAGSGTPVSSFFLHWDYNKSVDDPCLSKTSVETVNIIKKRFAAAFGNMQEVVCTWPGESFRENPRFALSARSSVSCGINFLISLIFLFPSSLTFFFLCLCNQQACDNLWSRSHVLIPPLSFPLFAQFLLWKQRVTGLIKKI